MIIKIIQNILNITMRKIIKNVFLLLSYQNQIRNEMEFEYSR